MYDNCLTHLLDGDSSKRLITFLAVSLALSIVDRCSC